ncbi:MAG TPA: molybdopterin molybdotransferase MoeA [Pedobacter sp.]|nr:molybdopterin molybdotransferase MoeA [Pedobacter sp.]
MISFDEAKDLIRLNARISKDELIDLIDADGRTLAADVTADRDYPPFNRSAMDGYALIEEDWLAGIRNYFVAETIFAGQPSSVRLESGQCYKIMTGAAVPVPANAVIRVEDSEPAGSFVNLSAGQLKTYMNIAVQGEDLKEGAVVLKKSMRLTPQSISILAAVGLRQVLVKKIPRVAVITTGDEVVEPGIAVMPYQIRNSNSYLIRSMLKICGIIPDFVTHAADDQEVIKNTLTKALQSELVIINGGVSAGDADYVPQLLEALHVRKLFHKVAIRPGKPIWIGVKPDGGFVFALPGNPFSCMVTFNLFVKYYLNLVQGLETPGFLRLPFDGSRVRKVNLEEFFPVILDTVKMKLQPAAINGSGDVRLGLKAQAIALHPKQKDVINQDELVDFFFL